MFIIIIIIIVVVVVIVVTILGMNNNSQVIVKIGSYKYPVIVNNEWMNLCKIYSLQIDTHIHIHIYS